MYLVIHFLVGQKFLAKKFTSSTNKKFLDVRFFRPQRRQRRPDRLPVNADSLKGKSPVLIPSPFRRNRSKATGGGERFERRRSLQLLQSLQNFGSIIKSSDRRRKKTSFVQLLASDDDHGSLEPEGDRRRQDSALPEVLRLRLCLPPLPVGRQRRLVLPRGILPTDVSAAEVDEDLRRAVGHRQPRLVGRPHRLAGRLRQPPSRVGRVRGSHLVQHSHRNAIVPNELNYPEQC